MSIIISLYSVWFFIFSIELSKAGMKTPIKRDFNKLQKKLRLPLGYTNEFRIALRE